MSNSRGSGESSGKGRDFPLSGTAALLNDRLGLYLSQAQQKGLATGLLVGAALSGALIGWNLTTAVRRRLGH